MTYIIDGHNLIPNIPNLSLNMIDDELHLVKILIEYCRLRRKKINVYFDKAAPGHQGVEKFGLVTAHFVREGRTVDEVIIARLAKEGRNAKNITVISSDRVIQVSAREVGAKVIPSQVFAKEISSTEIGISEEESEPSDITLSDDEVDEWLELFNKGQSNK
jgi:predicted RNA-binding protein with PIN domain